MLHWLFELFKETQSRGNFVSFTCVSCNETNDVSELRLVIIVVCFCVLEAKPKKVFLRARYRVILSLSDETGTTAFLGFDTEVVN